MSLKLQDYGVRVYQQGIDVKLDQRVRGGRDGVVVLPSNYTYLGRARRSMVSGLSRDSAKRLEFIAANVSISFASMLTLTYHANPRDGETEPERNARVARQTKRDLNRFLTVVRLEIGEYLWVQEFQSRGVVHYHVLCEKPIREERVRVSWLRAIGDLSDESALRHGVKVEAIHSPNGAQSYVGRYMGKERQKSLPEGVAAAGRWWGRSRGLKLSLETESITAQRGGNVLNGCEVYVARQVRRFLTRQFGYKFRGGMVLDWGGRICTVLNREIPRLREAFERYNAHVSNTALKLAERSGFEFIEALPSVDDYDEPAALASQLESTADSKRVAAERASGDQKARSLVSRSLVQQMADSVKGSQRLKLAAAAAKRSVPVTRAPEPQTQLGLVLPESSPSWGDR